MGYGIVEGVGNKLKHIDNGAIFTDTKDPLPLRLKTLYDGISGIIEKYNPQVLSVEEVFFAKNAKSAMKLGHARGVAILTGVNRGLEIYEYSATAIKSAVVGYGRAEKGQVQQMVKILLNLPEVPQADAADALAASICHINTAGTNKSLQLLKKGNKGK